MEELRILVIEDEPVQREMLAEFLAGQGHTVQVAASGPEGLAAVKYDRFDLVITDFRMPQMTGLEVLKEIKKINPEISVVVLTAYGTIETAVAAMKEGAYDYLTKPIDLDELAHLAAKVEERRQLIEENKELRRRLKERYNFDQMVAESGAMQEVLSLAIRVADSNATVLVRGESGTGKELVAKAVHYNSPRHAHPLVKVNCASIPENLLESELFGHEKGAFTGATVARMGRFEAAQGGTVFLDEIGDLSSSLQVKLLRVLQDKEFERLGSNRTIKVDVRIIAATHQDLEAAVKKNRFREDLYYRLNVVSIFIPPLRERRQDIPALLDHFLKRFGSDHKKEIRGITPQAQDILMKYNYPGNVRELENIVARAVILARGAVISEEDIPLHLRAERPLGEAPGQAFLVETVAALERQMILAALDKHDGVQTRAALELGISERVLRYKMRKYQLNTPEKEES